MGGCQKGVGGRRDGRRGVEEEVWVLRLRDTNIQFNNKQVMGMCMEHKEYGQQYYNNLVWGLMTLKL